MRKNIIKTLCATFAIIGVLGGSKVTATDLDTLYKNAYNLTQVSLSEKTQKSVNEAREAIKLLPTKMDWAIGEFSKTVDTVQHPILVNIVDNIEKAEKEPNQINVNAAKASIPPELNPVFKNSYSSAVDSIQQKLQENALELVKIAEREKTNETIDSALLAINDLMKSSSTAIVNWTNILLTRVNEIVILEENEDNEVYYIVEPGDNLSDIANKYGTTYKIIADLNNITDPYIIYPGQKLKIK